MTPVPGLPCVTPSRRGRGPAPPRARLAATAAVLCATATLGCQPLSQIILIVQSNMNDQIGEIDLTIAGPTSTVTKSYPTDIKVLPTWTLGLTPSGSATSPLSVKLVALQNSAVLVEQDASTEFVDGESRILRMLLLTSCMGVVCPSGQTCGGTSQCGPVSQLGTSLPTWNGSLPPEPSVDPTLPIRDRTVWAAGWHSCALDGMGLYCWGQNKFGELGNNTTLNSTSRQRVVLGANMSLPLRAVGLGTINTCVCDGSGQAYCWGDNSSGQIGSPSVMTAQPATSVVLQPVPVDGLTDCVQIGGGSAHMCAVHENGQVSCWGDNTFGQVGGKGTPITTPTLVRDAANLPFANVVEVFGGEDFTCARRMDGTIWCWGDNADHRLGDGSAVAMRNVPGQVVGVTDAVELAAGRFTSCARLSGGSVMCWGQNTNGELGTGDTKASKVPVPVVGVTDAAQIALGRDHTCVLHAAGSGGGVTCWGSNQYGQLGIGITGGAARLLPGVSAVGVQNATSIAAGSVHTCARHSKGLSCWGENVVYELGDNTNTNRAQPVLVSGFP